MSKRDVTPLKSYFFILFSIGIFMAEKQLKKIPPHPQVTSCLFKGRGNLNVNSRGAGGEVVRHSSHDKSSHPKVVIQK